MQNITLFLLWWALWGCWFMLLVNVADTAWKARIIWQWRGQPAIYQIYDRLLKRTSDWYPGLLTALAFTAGIVMILTNKYFPLPDNQPGWLFLSLYAVLNSAIILAIGFIIESFALTSIFHFFHTRLLRRQQALLHEVIGRQQNARAGRQNPP
jgi:uncharacterized membrane protein (DUF485 family)